MKKLILILASFLLVNLANAHPGHEVTFLQSFMHPILGWDHLLTILIIGMMVQAYPLAKGVYLPVSFISFFTIGALLGTMIPDFNQISTLMNQFVLSTLIGLAIMNIFSKKIRFEFILLVLGILALFTAVCMALNYRVNNQKS
jgi:urease accessory protein